MKFFLPLTVFVFVALSNLYSQNKDNIKGDTFYVHEIVVMSIKFPASVNEVTILKEEKKSGNEALYSLKKVSNTVQITASKGANCANVIIDEGTRSHNIVLCYKENLNENESYFDLSTLQKLRDFIEKSNARKASLLVQNNPSLPLQTTPAGWNDKKRKKDKEKIKADQDEKDESTTVVKEKKVEQPTQVTIAKETAPIIVPTPTPDLTGIPYDTLVARAKRNGINNNLKTALIYYNMAQELKPSDAITQNINSLKKLISQDSIDQLNLGINISKVQDDIRRRKAINARDAYAKYDEVASLGKESYEEQVYWLTQYLNIVPNDSVYALYFNTDQYSKNPVGRAKNKIEQIRAAWKKENYHPTIDSIPYLDQDLEEKFPSLNIKSIAEQKWDAIDNAGASESISYSKAMNAEKPRLALEDNLDSAKITIEAINFAKGKIFIKVRINNNSTVNDFITGAMNLSSGKKNKTVFFYPDYIFARPIIKPGNQYTTIYSSKEPPSGDDGFFFDVYERQTNKMLRVKISSEDYAAERSKK